MHIIWHPQQRFSLDRVWVIHIYTVRWTRPMLTSDGFILDRNQWDCLPIDDMFGGDRVSEVKKKQLKDAGYWGYIFYLWVLTKSNLAWQELHPRQQRCLSQNSSGCSLTDDEPRAMETICKRKRGWPSSRREQIACVHRSKYIADLLWRSRQSDQGPGWDRGRHICSCTRNLDQ